MNSRKIVKVPVIMQMEALECGAASLAMILAYYKKWIPLERVRGDCDVSRDGSTAVNIVKAGRNYGLQASGHGYKVEHLMEKATFPCIIWWNFNHFVVLNGFKGKGEKKKAIINDPAEGTVTISIGDFNRSYSGVCLIFEPAAGFKPEGRPQSMIAFISERLHGSMASLSLIMLVSFLAAIPGVLSPVFNRVLTDRILGGGNLGWIPEFIAAFGVLAVFAILVNILLQWFNMKIRGKMAIVSNSNFMWHILRLPMTFFSQRLAGDLANRQTSNDNIADTLVINLAPTLISIVMLTIYFIVMIQYNIILTAVGVGSVVINTILAQMISKKRLEISRTQMRDEGKLVSSLLSGIDMIETIKSAGAENSFFEKWAGNHARIKRAEEKMTKTESSLGVIPQLVLQISNAAVLTLGALFIMRGYFTGGLLVAFMGFMQAFYAPIGNLISIGQSVQEMRGQMERVNDVMKYKPDVTDVPNELDDISSFDKLTGRIEMKNITFGYSKLSPPLIENFNMTLTPGKKVAFVGSSGCGKSTLAKLLSGLYEPWSGEILFDGKPRQDIPRSVFSASLAVVDQDVIMFEDTIGDNIKMWDDSIADFEVIMAARDADVHNDVMLRDGGYSHMVAEGGKNFSGGQRQRFEIARVLAQDPTIIIMDEATSALDAKTEFNVINSIKDRGITCVVIAHRLSTIRDCDEIIVMDKGKVVERGIHDELYQAGGLYSWLVSVE
jgi:NHLM bacteriocin system ABC transporter peptidase/ATP-binding protein